MKRTFQRRAISQDMLKGKINHANWGAENHYFCADRIAWTYTLEVHVCSVVCIIFLVMLHYHMQNSARVLLQVNLEVDGVQILRYGTKAP